MPLVTVGTTSVDYRVSGSGPGLVLVHGTGADADSNWAPLVEAVGHRFTVVAVNLPGAGETADRGEPLTVEGLADQVAAAAADAGLAEYHIVGHSLGAVVATAVAARRTDEVLSLFAHAGWVTSGPREIFQFDYWARLLRADKELLARLLQLTAMSPATLAARGTGDFEDAAAGFTALLDGRILRQIELDARVDISPMLQRIKAPAMFLAGAHDLIVPPRHQRELADRVYGAGYREVEGGHALPFENPELFVAVVAEWLDGF
ncbi:MULTISPECIES: alpha/beta fold hydrolase [Streptosporangium]|uniref:Pimeloyl-ACP methyl ester carboxylesterase n=1 Tax=Streptosporangium brasiliense TaxID=47480 RepID=A0ABT9R4A0_9ACTN|nr:alpha/beta hydrolase [Streptosporangium brasiliense]MDP9864054.1 pimeloyl-ACP methyl ester carboxylesterase [Streptosporangium brasiliense]